MWLRDILLDYGGDQYDTLYLLLSHPAIHLETTGVVSWPNELKWQKNCAEMCFQLDKAMSLVLHILQQNSCSVTVETNSNALNSIKVSFCPQILRYAAINYQRATDGQAQYAALHQLLSTFKGGTIFFKNFEGKSFYLTSTGWCEKGPEDYGE